MAVEIEVLKSLPYFAGLSPAALEAVKRYVFERSFNKNELIVSEQERDQVVYFVVAGVVKAYKTSVEGKEQVLCILRPGESFNDAPAFDGGPNPASAVAMGSVVLYGINGPDMEAILRAYPSVALNVVKVLAGKVRHFVSLVEDLSFRHVTGRIAKLLLESARDHPDLGKATGSPPRLTQQEMAARVGTAREVVGRTLKALEVEGAIRMDRHRIVIINKEILAQISGVSG